jgi:hypothetical protein
VIRPVPAHYIKENRAAYVPKRIVILDSEAISERMPDGETQSWRCGAAQFIHWTSKGVIHRDTRGYTSPGSLWSDIGDHARPKQRTIVYAHNLPYDIRITKALQYLPDSGWSLGAIRIAQQGSWSRWSRSAATLTLCDSTSLFPVTLYTLGQFRGRRKLPLPETDDIEPWLDRCIRDVEILADTIVEYFEWLRTGVAGNWQLTGAGQSWSHWRHAHYTHPVLVHADGTAVAAERRAMWTGRAEAWRWGLDYDTPVYEWDWQNAYPRIARECDLPVALAATAGPQSLRDYHNLKQRYAVLADLEVNTTQPVVPTRHDGRILWPVGSFTTTLWDPEIDALIDSGATIKLNQVWLYKKAPALKQWATWVLGELHAPGAPQHRWYGVLLKHWSRALIGRFATQYQNWEPFGIDSQSRVQVGRMHDVDTGEDSDFMQIGHEIHVMTGLSDGDDSCPQITSYIMSRARVKLWRAMVAAGLSSVLYVDTDSLVLNTEGSATMRRLSQSGQFEGLRLKGRHRGFEIWGPRAAVIGGEEKLSGIPRNSYRLDQERWKGEVWTQLERAIKTGEWDRVTITPRRFSVKWNEHRRARVASGGTTPYRLPEYEPASAVGRIPATTDAERAAAIRRGLKGCASDSRQDNPRNIPDVVRRAAL